MLIFRCCSKFLMHLFEGILVYYDFMSRLTKSLFFMFMLLILLCRSRNLPISNRTIYIYIYICIKRQTDRQKEKQREGGDQLPYQGKRVQAVLLFTNS